MDNFTATLLLLGVLAIIAAIVISCLINAASQPRSLPVPEHLLDLKHPISEPSPGHYESWIPPGGREVFFPKPLHQRAVYRLTITGVICYEENRDWSKIRRYADGKYKTDHTGNFTDKHFGLLVNGSSLASIPHEVLESDRGDHRYSYEIDDPGERLTIALSFRDVVAGGIFLHVEVMTPEATPIIERRRMATVGKQAERDETEIAERFAGQIKALCVRAEVLRNWGDRDFQSRFAEVNGDELLRRQAEIRSTTIQFLDQTKIVQYLRRHNPEVVQRLLGEFEALLIAENLATQKHLPPPPAPRMTIEEFRGKMCRRVEVSGGDKLAVLTTIEEQRSRMLAAVESLPIEDDAREQYRQEIDDWATGEIIRLSEKTKGSNETLKTIG